MSYWFVERLLFRKRCIQILLLTLDIVIRPLEKSLEGKEGREKGKEVNERVCAELDLRSACARLAAQPELSLR